jgi:membrane-associated phospholipid phosphatase
MKPQPFWHWPGWRQIGFFLLLAGAVTVWFAIIYGGANFITGLHRYRVRLHLDAELAIPFVPQAVLGYMSIYAAFWMAPFILRTRQELQALARTLLVVILVAGVCFLIFPGELHFPPDGDTGIWTGLVHFAKELALAYNLAPSLHVALTVVCITIYARQAGSFGKGLLWLWSGAICLSTLLLHQHHVIDVVTGFVLGLAGVHWVYDRHKRNTNPSHSYFAAGISCSQDSRYSADSRSSLRTSSARFSQSVRAWASDRLDTGLAVISTIG